MSVAVPVSVERDPLAMLAPLFRYPDARFPQVLEAARRVAPLDRFASETRDRDLQAIYTATFDLAPLCSPYLGVHLFSEEARERARLMVGFKLAYARGGMPPSKELPDHIAEVLAFAPRFEEEEWKDLVRLVLSPALVKMNAALAPASNPYRHVVTAAGLLCQGGAS
jgi:nitrate reductase molybdenum cofactor assembly chaperone NarJ/NarW